jgi:hypothetical protein
MALDRQLAQILECRRGTGRRRVAGAHDAPQGADDLDIEERTWIVLVLPTT